MSTGKKRSCLAMMSSESSNSSKAKKNTANASIEYEIFCKLSKDGQTSKNALASIRKGSPWPAAKIVLTKPSDDEECPITLELIKDSKLDWMPADCHFVKGKPELSKATLVCGHSFSAINLMYLWCKQSMRCPCCREGFDFVAGTDSIPVHFRSQMADHIKRVTRKEKDEDEEDSLREMQSLFGIDNRNGLSIPFSSLADADELSVSIHYLEEREGQSHYRVISITTVNLRTAGSTPNANSHVFSPTAHDVRFISNTLTAAGIHTIRLFVALRLPDTSGVYIESSDIITIPSVIPNSLPRQAGGHMVVQGLGGLSASSDDENSGNEGHSPPKSEFHLNFDSDNKLTELTWVPNKPHFNSFRI